MTGVLVQILRSFVQQHLQVCIDLRLPTGLNDAVPHFPDKLQLVFNGLSRGLTDCSGDIHDQFLPMFDSYS